MGNKVTFDYSKAGAFIRGHEVQSMKKIAEAAKAELLGREGAGNDFLGWIDLPVDYDKEEFARIKKIRRRLSSSGSEALIWEREPLLNSCATASIIWRRRKCVRRRRFILQGTASAAHI